MPNPINIKVGEREYIITGEVWKQIPTKKGTNKYNLEVFKHYGAEVKEGVGGNIYGIVILRNSQNSTAQKKFKNCKVLNDVAFHCARLSIFAAVGKTPILEDVPLERYAFDTYDHLVGSYAQVILLDGFNYDQSCIEFDDAQALEDDECIAMGLIRLEQVNCPTTEIGC